MKQRSEAEMLYRMAAWCSTGVRAMNDIRKKLQAAELTEEEQQRIMARLKEENYVSEVRFTQAFVNDKLRYNKWGRIKINVELQRKGISSEQRAEILATIDETEYYAILLKLLQDKQRTTKAKDSRDMRTKLLRFAAGRGFTMSESLRCLQQLIEGNEDEEDYTDDFF